MKKILLLDDNLDTLQLVQDVLAYEGYEIKAESKSVGFVELAEAFGPDLMIIDYLLDDGNGGDVCDAVKGNPALQNTPVILFSAFPESRKQIMDHECDAVIAKPFDLVNFLKTVRKLMGLNPMTGQPDQQ